MFRAPKQFLVALFILTGCQTTNPDHGSGFIYLSPVVEVVFQTYLADDRGRYFAVSTDGQNFGYSICTWGAFNCEETGGNLALRGCHSRSDGVPCKIYAEGKKVVWQGIDRTDDSIAPVKTEIGRGPITLPEKTRAAFDKYLNLPNPQYFAVSKDGHYYGRSQCKDGACLNPYKTLAVSICQAKSSGAQRCYIYAKGDKVVWKP